MRSTICGVFCLILLSSAGADALRADEKPRKIDGWGEFVDPAVSSKVKLDRDVLVMTAPDNYVDNFNKTTAPRVMRPVSSDLFP